MGRAVLGWPDTTFDQPSFVQISSEHPIYVTCASAVCRAAAPAEAGATAAAALPAEQGRLRRGDVAGVLRTLRQDYERYQYFVTGVVSDAIYVEDCVFADPTVSFKGGCWVLGAGVLRKALQGVLLL